jgi:hypothetical protein
VDVAKLAELAERPFDVAQHEFRVAVESERDRERSRPRVFTEAVSGPPGVATKRGPGRSEARTVPVAQEPLLLDVAVGLPVEKRQQPNALRGLDSLLDLPLALIDVLGDCVLDQ